MSEVSEIIKHISNNLKLFPLLTSIQYERDYNWIPYTNYAKNNYHIVFGLVIGYLLFIMFGTTIMARRDTKPYDLRLLLALWNAILSIFSFIGMCKTVCMVGCMYMYICIYLSMYLSIYVCIYFH